VAGGLVAWWQAHQPRPPFLVPGCQPGTALITGASSGIGAAFARRLAGEGCNLILLARREDQLTRLAETLQQIYSIRVDVWAADLANQANVEHVEAEIARLDDLTLLINNAGFGTTTSFVETDPGKQLDMIRVHIEASTRFCRAALPKMIARDSGAIINVSSISAFFSTPGSVVYCASKAYLNTLSKALQNELADTGVRVQSLCPGFTYSDFHDGEEFRNFKRSNLPKPFWSTPEEVVAESLQALDRTQVVVIPGILNQLVIAGAQTGLSALVQKTARQVLRLRGSNGWPLAAERDG
jgi:short-subunit dehydrogenase